MCISNKRRTVKTSDVFPNMDFSLMNRLNTKTRTETGYSFDMSAFEPTPMAEPASSRLTASPAPRQPQHLELDAPPSAHIIIQHDYHDHSNDVRSNYQEQHPARGGVLTPFPLKLHEMLSAVAAAGQEDIVSWQPHGRCFVVHKPKEFVELLPGYFKLSKLPSFQRQLNLYGFQRLTRGRDKGGYYHELFLRGRVFLSHNIQRVKVKGTGVRARSNPDQEPDLWSMSWLEESIMVTASDSSSSDASLPVSSPSLFKLPLQLDQPSMQAMLPAPWNKEDDDLLSAFNSQPFNFIPSQQQGLDALLASEAESFFDDFDFPQEISDEIESDDVFGDLLEQMIA